MQLVNSSNFNLDTECSLVVELQFYFIMLRLQLDGELWRMSNIESSTFSLLRTTRAKMYLGWDD
jgi:hypothetical protein